VADIIRIHEYVHMIIPILTKPRLTPSHLAAPTLQFIFPSNTYVLVTSQRYSCPASSPIHCPKFDSELPLTCLCLQQMSPEPYDPYVAPTAGPSNPRTAAVQEGIDETVASLLLRSLHHLTHRCGSCVRI
jgi:hypothetical protein